MNAFSRYAVRCELRTLTNARDTPANLLELVNLVGDDAAVPVSGDALTQLKHTTRRQQIRARRRAAARLEQATT